MMHSFLFACYMIVLLLIIIHNIARCIPSPSLLDYFRGVKFVVSKDASDAVELQGIGLCSSGSSASAELTLDKMANAGQILLY
jgi:hypothetical protein